MGIAAFVVASSSAQAQFVQYTTPGDVLRTEVIDQERLEQSMETARWRVGRLFADPWIGLTDLSIVSSSEDDDGVVTDRDRLRVSGGAGIRAYVPVGSRSTWAVHVLPEYSWVEGDSDRSRLNGRYGTGLFANLGGALVQATVTRRDTLEFFSQELERQTNRREDQAKLAFEVALRGAFSIFLEGSFAEHRSLEDEDSTFDITRGLDRDVVTYGGGVRLESERGLRLGLGLEIHDVESADEVVLDRSSDGETVFVAADYRRDSFDLTLRLGHTSLDFENPLISGLSEVTGNLGFRRRLSERVAFDVFARSSPALSLTSAYSIDESFGAGLQFRVSNHLAARVFYQLGENRFEDFADPAGTIPAISRVDESDTYGVALTVQTRWVNLKLSGRRSEYDSSLPGLDRDNTIVQGGLSVGSSVLLGFFSLGSEGGAW